jgi:hypothetical protein
LALPNRILSYQKIVKGECNSKRKNEVFTDLILQNRILSSIKTMKGECNYERTNIAFTYFSTINFITSKLPNRHTHVPISLPRLCKKYAMKNA